MSKLGLAQLREERDRTIAKWEKSGLLDGLSGGTINETIAHLFEGQTRFDMIKHRAKEAEKKWFEGEMKAYHIELKDYLSS